MAEPSVAARSFDGEALPHLDTLYRVALRLTADPTLAEDLVQDTMLKAYRSWQQYRPGTNARGWLLTILRNTFINDYRRRKHEPVAMDLEAVEPHALYRSIQDTDPEGNFFSQIVDAKVTDAIDGLPADFREVLALSDIEGMSYAEISETLKIPTSTPTPWKWVTSNRGSQQDESAQLRRGSSSSPGLPETGAHSRSGGGSEDSPRAVP
jgi:RNA polymerase sigma-70 factor (ECF subfamily)